MPPEPANKTRQPQNSDAPVLFDDADLSTPPAAAPQGRKRPLRTYGRRSAPSKEAEPTPKKQKVRDVKSVDSSTEEPSPKPLQLPQLPEAEPPEPPKRGLILSYFKRLPSASSVQPVASSGPTEPISPPPSSPIPLPRVRKRRRLTNRPAFETDDSLIDNAGRKLPRDEDEDGDEDEGRGEQQNMQECSPEGKLDISSDNDTRESRALGEISSNALNQLEVVSSATKKPTPPERKKSGRRPLKDKVQMTLNLSMSPGPGFTICKECGILYNPLNEKDRKEHKKQHAAHVRSKARSQPTE
ncbi:hypothetical protein B0T25DRAFT_289172 [Lasiosphaeria hispida]|uniref:N-acetyltransferase ESCO zinc-finger domain-containing protein n=1 Tax=Lasiosphaeria hispida TaxID=260671 RepID=A0AAJ0HC24_9PEZI|nr:hypothetical protein B0T25DRAFT_289172 [Lasiosphaeria hispida]